MRVAVFSTKRYDRDFLTEANDTHGHQLVFLEPRLVEETAQLAAGCEAVCAFVNDRLGADVLRQLHDLGVRLIALRSAGFNHVDLHAAHDLGMVAARVPAYSPEAVAEHAVGLVLSLNRRLHRAYARVREGNFSLDGLMGFDLMGRTVGIVGTGKIGTAFARIMAGFRCVLLASDPVESAECIEVGVTYVGRDELFSRSDIVSLHCPLTPDTYHLIDHGSLSRMRDGVMLINTSRGGLVDTGAVIQALKSGRVGLLGLDVYEEESDLFFEDLSEIVIHDDVFMRLLTFPNVLITGHQGFFTRDAVARIAETTLANVTAFERGDGELHEVTVSHLAP